MNRKRLGIFLGSIALLIVCSFAAYQYWLAPTRILIINATLAQAYRSQKCLPCGFPCHRTREPQKKYPPR